MILTNGDAKIIKWPPEPMTMYLLSQKRYTIPNHTTPTPNTRNTNHPWATTHGLAPPPFLEESSQGLPVCFQRIISFYFMLSPKSDHQKGKNKFYLFFSASRN